MRIEHAVLTAWLATGQIDALRNLRVGLQFFSDPLLRDVIRWVADVASRTGTMPTMDLVCREFPDVDPEPSSDALPVLADQLRRKKVHVDVAKVIREADRLLTEGDPDKALDVLHGSSSDLVVQHKYSEEDVELEEAPEELWNQYQRNKEADGVVGYPTPWATLTSVTKGWRAGDHIGLYGETGVGKSWVAVGIMCHHKQIGGSPLLLTKETPAPLLRARASCQLAGIDYEKWQDGALDPEEEEKYADTLAGGLFPIIGLFSDGKDALADIESLIRKHKPTFVMVDGAYLCAENLDWKEFGTFSNGFRQMARRLKIPLGSTNQANSTEVKERRDVRDIAYAKAYAQSTTVLLRIKRTAQHEDLGVALIEPKKVNEGGKVKSVVIDYKPGRSFAERYCPEEAEDDPEGSDIT